MQKELKSEEKKKKKILHREGRRPVKLNGHVHRYC
jgi:hypothetical protein